MKMTDERLSGIELLDQMLRDSMTIMECFVGRLYYSESERKKLKSMDAIDWFCANARNRLEVLRKQGKYPELFEPLLCNKQTNYLTK